MSDDVMEAMARAIHNTNPGVHEPWANIVAAESLGNPLAKRTAALRRAEARAEARAAIRAVTARGGLVVGKMPEDAVCTDDAGDQESAWVNGCNHGYAAVRAAAVEVEP